MIPLLCKGKDKWIYSFIFGVKTHKVVTKYLTYFYFGRATAADIVQKIMAYQENGKVPCEHPFDLSYDGPNISKAVWSGLNATLNEMGHQGLIRFFSCSLYI